MYPLYGFQDSSTQMFTGYFYGSAGFGLTLLTAHYTSIGERARLRRPDDPFGGGRPE